MKSIIYYTHNILEEPIFSLAQGSILKAGLPIVSCSLEPMDFGKNIVINLKPGAITMFKQILTALEASTADIIFFCEHDVFYHPSHFDFTPSADDTFYYNVNVWRWDYPKDRAITYDFVVSTSGLCANRELLVKHYRKRLKTIREKGFTNDRDPRWARRMGYEPKDKYEHWRSEYPNIDIRHKGTITKSKTHLRDFKHKPDIKTWKEVKLDEIKGWKLKEIFDYVNPTPTHTRDSV